MSLKILIDHTRLTDSPYCESKSSSFNFTTSDTSDFVQDMINGTPTSYLISGYRGSGKSSFIKKLESDVNKIDKKLLFIHLNFAKHEVKSILLRKLIRGLHLKIHEEINVDKNNDPELSSTLKKLEDLHERTFYNVSKNTVEKQEVSLTTTLAVKATLKDIILFISGILGLTSIIIGFKIENWYTWLIAAFFGLGIWKVFSYESSKSTSERNTSETAKSLLYDDEIAEHHLTEILSALQKKITPVFVLDELDKIHNEELVESLMNELKPIMLSGLAFFIVVAGQSLFYNYFISKTRDDSPLSSLFSKVHHVSLFSAAELRVLFDGLVKTDKDQLSNEDTSLLNAYINFLIFESKRIPRRFNILIRQNITWEGKSSYLVIDKPLTELEVYSKLLQCIEKIDDKEIASKPYPMAIRDYFNMHLLLNSEKVLKSQNVKFSIPEIIR